MKIFLLSLSIVVLLPLAGCQSLSQSSSSSSQSSSSSSAPSQQNTQATPSPSATSQRDEAQQEDSAPSQPGGSESKEEQVAGGQPPPPPGGAEVMTAEETISELDNELNDSLVVFDDMMGDARTNTAPETAADGEDAAAPVGGPLFEEGDLGDDQEGGAMGSAGSEEESPGGWGDTDQPASGSATTTYGKDGGVTGTLPGGAVPKNIPDGSDDDIVARQIREAAMKEQDPVLREKLWDEYRKYKQGQ